MMEASHAARTRWILAIALVVSLLLVVLSVKGKNGTEDVPVAASPIDQTARSTMRGATSRKQVGSQGKAFGSLQQQRDRAEKSRLNSARARAEREASQKRYRDQNAKEALATALKHQPSVAKESAWTPPKIRSGEKITAYTSEHVAMVKLPGAKSRTGAKGMIVQSTSPIAVETNPGEFSPEDLRLAFNATTGSWAPKRSNVASEIPRSLAKPVEIGSAADGSQVGVTPADSNAAGVVTGGSKMYYANSSADTDTIAEPVPSGVSFSWILRSPESPSTQRLRFDLPEDASLRLSGEGSAEIVRDGAQIGTITAPIATDAQGQPVEAKFDLAGDALEVQISHVGKDLAYPIAVDPVVNIEGGPAMQAIDNGTAIHPDWLNGSGWSVGAPSGTRVVGFINQTSGGSNRFNLETRGTSGSGYGYWVYDPIRSSAVARVRFEYARKSHSNIQLAMGTITPSGWNTGQWVGYYDSLNPTVLVGAGSGGPFVNAYPYTMPNATDVLSCSAPGCVASGPSNSAAYFELATASNSANNLHSEFLGAQVFVTDNDTPYLSNGATPAAGWQKSDQMPTLQANDPGLGLGKTANGQFGTAIEANLDGNGYSSATSWGPDCEGGPLSYCPDTFVMPRVPMQGAHSVTYRARDILGKTSTSETTYQFYNDTIAPVVKIGGRLGGMVEADGAWGNSGRVPRTISRSLPFNINFSDAAVNGVSNAASGVKDGSWKIYKATSGGGIDKSVTFGGAAMPTQPCTGVATQKNCGYDLAGTINPASLDPGVYYLYVQSVDGAGNVQENSYKFASGVGDISSISEGQGTARYVPMQVELNRSGLSPAATAVRLQWRSTKSTWKDIPASAIKRESDGATQPSNSFALSTSGCAQSSSISCTARFIIDLELLSRNGTGTPGSTADRLRDGQYVFRGVFTPVSPPTTDDLRSSEDVSMELDRGGNSTADDQSDIPGGSVDLVSGNYAMEEDDVSQDAFRGSLSISRSYGSRYASAKNDQSIGRDVNPLGPGWEFGFPSGSAPYQELVDNSDTARAEDDQFPYVEVAAGDGSTITFEQSQIANSDGTDRFTPEAGNERLQLTRQTAIPGNPATATTSFTLTDLDTNVVTVFGTRDMASNDGTFAVSRVDNPGSATGTTYSYSQFAVRAVDPDKTETWPSRMLAATPGTTTDACSSSNMGSTPEAVPSAAARGCQALDFKYSDVNVGTNMANGYQWGWATANGWKMVTGDWNGDGVDNVGGFTSSGQWYLSDSNANPNATMRITPAYGVSTDMPVAGDWDGDGKDSLGVFRPSNGTWHLSNSTTSPASDAAAGVQWGVAGDQPVVGDWDGDGKDTIGVYRPSTGQWWLSTSNTSPNANASNAIWGDGNMRAVSGDWNNDGKDDTGLYSNGAYFYRNTTIATPNSSTRTSGPWGVPASMQPTAGDWNGDGVSSIGLFGVTDATWYLSNSNSNPSAQSQATEKRLTSIYLKTWDPAAGAMVSKEISRYVYDSEGRLKEQYDPRLATPLKDQYEYDSNNLMTKYTPPGEVPSTISYSSSSYDLTPGRLKDTTRVDPVNGAATYSVKYGVPLTTGAGGPYDMSNSGVSQWAQAVPPLLATAVFSPDRPPNGSTPSNWGDASISYLDPLGREVNSAAPGGRISVTEYDRTGNVTRTLTAENRARAMAASNPAQASRKWDTQMIYADVPGSTTGATHLTEVLGPEHQIRLDDNTWVTGRNHTRTTYDEGSPIAANPSKEPFDLVTTTRDSALVDGTDRDVRTTKLSYGDTEDEWKLGIARTTTDDPDGLNIIKKVSVNSDGLVTRRFQPRSQSSAEPSTTQIIYYSAGSNAEDASCGGRPEWVGLACKTKAGAQPSSSGLAELPVTTTTYDYLRQPVSSSESVVDASGNTQTRTTTRTYDAVGRALKESIQGTVGASIRTNRHTYSAASGREITLESLSADESTTYKTVSHDYDSLGRLTSYTDGDGHTSTTTYDLLGRVKTSNDGKGTRTATYDPLTGDLIQMVDSAAGTFQATYNADGEVATETLPGGIVKSVSTDATGSPTQKTYTRTTGCSSGCVLFDNSAVENAHGQINGLWTTLSGQNQTTQLYNYDAAGRLTRAEDYTEGAGCELRDYEFDKDSNRTSKKVRSSSGDCWAASTTTTTNSFDAADRLTNPGYTYDAFGRTTTVPAADAGGATALTATYYVNDLAQSITEGGTTQTLSLDPALRVSSKTKSGSTTSTEYYAYSSDADAPSWTSTSTTGTPFTRNVMGIDGGLVAVQDSASGIRLMIENLRGDVVAHSTTTGVLSNFSSVDEFGIPKSPLTGATKYAFHGGSRREALTPGGTIAMGARLYQPQTGRFLQVDPVLGGTANPYEYPSDPVNNADLDGRGMLRLAGKLLAKAMRSSRTARYLKKVGIKFVVKVKKAAKAHTPEFKRLTSRGKYDFIYQIKTVNNPDWMQRAIVRRLEKYFTGNGSSCGAGCPFSFGQPGGTYKKGGMKLHWYDSTATGDRTAQLTIPRLGVKVKFRFNPFDP